MDGPDRAVRHRAGRSASGSTLRQTFLDLGHTVELIDPLPGLPDMVFAANGAHRGRRRGARRAVPRRRARRRGARPTGRGSRDARLRGARAPSTSTRARATSSLAGDVLLAGTGFRTAHAAHAEAQELFGRPVISLQLVDPRFYHLDTALAVLRRPTTRRSPTCPPAFSPGSQRRAAPALPGRGRSPTSADAEVLGPQRGLRRPQRRRCPAQATDLAAAAARARLQTRSPSTSPSCARPAAAPSAAPWRSGHERRDMTRVTPAAVARRRALDRAQLPPAAGRHRRGRGRLGHRRRRPPLPRLPGRLLGAELRPPAPGADRRRARAARPGHADQPRVRPRPVRRVLPASWPSCAARTWCCR